MPQAKVAVKPKAAPKPKAKAAPKAKPAASAGSKRAASSKGTAKAMEVQEEVTSPANAPDKKVRRMRPSPFHKGSAPRVGEDEAEAVPPGLSRILEAGGSQPDRILLAGKVSLSGLQVEKK